MQDECPSGWVTRSTRSRHPLEVVYRLLRRRLEGCSQAVNVVSTHQSSYPTPLIERSGTNPSGIIPVRICALLGPGWLLPPTVGVVAYERWHCFRPSLARVIIERRRWCSFSRAFLVLLGRSVALVVRSDRWWVGQRSTFGGTCATTSCDDFFIMSRYFPYNPRDHRYLGFDSHGIACFGFDPMDFVHVPILVTSP